MGEERHNYAHNRVLIDSARVLSAQFDDAVIYVTGAQLELLRNVTQYLSRLTTYAAEIQPGYYLTPNVADFDDILEIVADLEETLMGNPNTLWGYVDRWVDRPVGTSIGDPITESSTDPVPEGYVYVLEHFTCFHGGTTTRAVELVIDLGGNNPTLYEAPALPAWDQVYQPTHITLKEGDYITFKVWDLAATKTALLRVWGYKMAVPD